MKQRYAIFLVVVTSSLLFACSTPPIYRNVIDHPGSYQVVHLGYDTKDTSLFKSILHGKEFFSKGATYIPSAQSAILLENTVIEAGDVVLDVGTGAGIQAIFAAQNAKKVVATDIDPNAITSTTINVKRHQLSDKIDIRLGDLFAPLKEGELFDVIICNIDYPYDVNADNQWYVHERFFSEVGKYLKHDGRIFYQSGWTWNIPKVMGMIKGNGFVVTRMLMLAAENQSREPIVYTIKHGLKISK